VLIWTYVCTIDVTINYTHATHVDTQANADRAAKMVKIQYKSKGKPILTIADALQANSAFAYPGEGNILIAGDAKGVLTTLYCVRVRACARVCVCAC